MIEPTYIFIKLLFPPDCAISIKKKKTPITQNVRLRTRSRCAQHYDIILTRLSIFLGRSLRFGREMHSSGIPNNNNKKLILYCFKFKHQ